MYKQNQQQAHAFRFRRFSRAKWAAYSSMHREVTIGRLASRVADSSLRKVAAVALLAALHTPLMAQSDTSDRETRTLPEVEITLGTQLPSLSNAEPAAVLTAADIQSSNIRSIGDLVALLPGVDLRVRGDGDVQGDLSMRGGTFDQMLILLDGVNLTDAQTGHHTMDIPIDPAMVQRVELLTPAQLLARGIVAYCGAVNIVVCDDYRDRLLARLGIGSHGTAHASLMATRATGPWALTVAGSYNRSDGFRPNTDYRHGSLLLQAARHAARHDLRLAIGAQAKGFGSAGFYSTTYPDQYEATRTLIATLSDHIRLGGADLHIDAYGRLHTDRFELFRDGYVSEVPSWYTGHNRHLSSLGGMRVLAVVPWGPGNLVGGIDVRREGIRSNVLGLPDSTLPAPYDHSDARVGASLFAGYRIKLHRLSAAATLLGNLHSQFGPRTALASEVAYDLPWATLRASFSHTYRLPTFTDLYYQSANQRANPDLGPEKSTGAELRLQGVPWKLGRRSVLLMQLTAYYRAGRQTIDWVRRPDEELWYSMNHTAVDARGVEAAARWQGGGWTAVASYAWCDIMADAGEWVSGSTHDYLRHQASVLLAYAIGDRWRLKGGLGLRHRQGQWADSQGLWHPYGTTTLLDAGVQYRLADGLSLDLESHNLLDQAWRDHGGAPQPGRTFMLSLTLDR